MKRNLSMKVESVFVYVENSLLVSALDVTDPTRPIPFYDYEYRMSGSPNWKFIKKLVAYAQNEKLAKGDKRY